VRDCSDTVLYLQQTAALLSLISIPGRVEIENLVLISPDWCETSQSICACCSSAI